MVIWFRYELPWYFDIWVILIIFFSTSGVVQAIMEKRYEENQKAYLLTISETAFGVVVVLSVISAIAFEVI